MTQGLPAWNASYDVVVVGYGAAGAVAAIEAADAGARVLLIEKMPDPGGISILSSGGLRISSNADDAFRYLKHTCGGRTPDDVLRTLANGMAAAPDYLRTLAKVSDAKVKVVPSPGNYPFPGCDALGYAEIESIPDFDPKDGYLAARPMRPGCLLFKVLLDNVEARRAAIDVWTSTAAQRLHRNGEGEIAGLRVVRNGETLEIAARRGVVLACGGFEANEEMKKQYLVSTPVINSGFRGNTGDGIRMAQAVGADLWHMWLYHGPYGLRHSDPDYPFGLYVKLLPMWTPERTERDLPRMAWIVVDQDGRRYVDEYPPYMSDTGVRQFDFYEPKTYRHPRLPSFLLFDEAGRKAYPLGRAITNDREAWYEWSDDNLREVENGILHRANSLAELAEQTGVDEAVLRATIERWNADCDAGVDTAFGRRPETMMPLREPPFYWGALWPVVINTQGGPVHDARQRVIDVEGQPIDRLYSAGELGSVFGHVYVSGGNLAECFIGGQIAGREAAARVPRG